MASTAAVLALVAVAEAQQMQVVGCNSESEDAKPAVVAQRTKEVDGCGFRGMCEVKDQSWANTFEAAAEDGEGADLAQVLGTGGADTLYDTDRFEKRSLFKLTHINIGGTLRAPLVVRLKLKGTRHGLSCEEITASQANVHTELVTAQGGPDDGCRGLSDHLPVTVDARGRPDGD